MSGDSPVIPIVFSVQIFFEWCRDYDPSAWREDVFDLLQDDGDVRDMLEDFRGDDRIKWRYVGENVRELVEIAHDVHLFMGDDVKRRD